MYSLVELNVHMSDVRDNVKGVFLSCSVVDCSCSIMCMTVAASI